jgi:hypothetical protein
MNEGSSEGMGGEYLSEEHVGPFDEAWRDEVTNVTPLIPRDHDLQFEGWDRNQERIEVLLPVEHGMDRKKKVIITAAAATTLTALGVGLIMRGRFSPKARKKS